MPTVKDSRAMNGVLAGGNDKAKKGFIFVLTVISLANCMQMGMIQ